MFVTFLAGAGFFVTFRFDEHFLSENQERSF